MHQVSHSSLPSVRSSICIPLQFNLSFQETQRCCTFFRLMQFLVPYMCTYVCIHTYTYIYTCMHMHTCACTYLAQMYLCDTEHRDRQKSIDFFSIKENAAMDFNRKKPQQYWSIIIYKMDHESKVSLLLYYMLLSQLFAAFPPCHLCPMHLLLALSGSKMMIMHGGSTGTSLAACCPLICSRKDPAPRNGCLDLAWAWISSMCLAKP